MAKGKNPPKKKKTFLDEDMDDDELEELIVPKKAVDFEDEGDLDLLDDEDDDF